MEDVVPFVDKLKGILRERGITIKQFCDDLGIYRQQFFYKKGHKHKRIYFVAIAYYLNMTVEELIDGTDAIDAWYD